MGETQTGGEVRLPTIGVVISVGKKNGACLVAVSAPTLFDALRKWRRLGIRDAIVTINVPPDWSEYKVLCSIARRGNSKYVLRPLRDAQTQLSRVYNQRKEGRRHSPLPVLIKDVTPIPNAVVTPLGAAKNRPN